MISETTYIGIIDGELVTYDSSGYVYGKDITGRNCRTSYHGSLIDAHNRGENTKVIASGHVYVAKYNKETHVETRPRTFKEYLEMKEKGEALWQPIKD